METVEDKFRVVMTHRFRSIEAAERHVPPSLWPYFLHPPSGQAFVAPLGTRSSPEVLAHVNHGRWLGDCPFCASSQHVSKRDPWFFCAACLNAAVDHHAVPVEWPKDADAIEETLRERPFVTTRNWRPGETVASLRAENRQHLPRG